jgi:hypothetical protein
MIIAQCPICQADFGTKTKRWWDVPKRLNKKINAHMKECHQSANLMVSVMYAFDILETRK